MTEEDVNIIKDEENKIIIQKEENNIKNKENKKIIQKEDKITKKNDEKFIKNFEKISNNNYITLNKSHSNFYEPDEIRIGINK